MCTGGDEALCVERVESQREVNIFSLRVGGKQPLHCGGAPRALLADWETSELAQYAERTGLPTFTSNTIRTLDQLLEDVENTRRQGYVVSMNDVNLGIAAVGAPVYDHTGRVVASISLSGLSTRYGPEHIAELGASCNGRGDTLFPGIRLPWVIRFFISDCLTFINTNTGKSYSSQMIKENKTWLLTEILYIRCR
jgi:DNA-binding IclR family transcriptional regulator